MTDVSPEVVETESLLPCPLCGSPADAREGWDYDQTPARRYWISCYSGMHTVEVDYAFADRAHAVAEWNGRTLATQGDS